MPTRFELLYRSLLPFEHALHQHAQRTLRGLAGNLGHAPLLLDIGGRRSNYTIGVPARVWISDIPRASEMQRTLDLGATRDIVREVLKRRSNVVAYEIDDMANTQFSAGQFQVACAIEVLEHVERDDDFVRNVSHVLAPGGWFVMSTPNGDFRPMPYPDHKRHYTKLALERLLESHFGEVRVDYRVNADAFFYFGSMRPSIRKPMRSLLALCALGINALYERLGGGGSGPMDKLHLFAVCRNNRH